MPVTRIMQVLLGCASISLYFLAHLHWFEVQASDELSGDQQLQVSGATAYAALQVLPWALLAGTIAVLALQGVVRRIVGVLVAVIAAGGLWIPIHVATSDPDLAHFQQILTSSTTEQAAALQSWAEVEEVTVVAGPVVGTALAFAIAVLAALYLVLRPTTGTQSQATSSKYETPQSRREALQADLEQDPDSGRVLWDALDADIDPTDKR